MLTVSSLQDQKIVDFCINVHHVAIYMYGLLAMVTLLLYFFEIDYIHAAVVFCRDITGKQ